MSEKPPCKLHPDTPKYKLDEKKKKQEGGGKTALCEECAPWQRYILYALPALIYLPWAIGKLRCAPKCCPPPHCCPLPPKPCPPPRQKTCAPHNPAKSQINPSPPKDCSESKKPLPPPKKKACEE